MASPNKYIESSEEEDEEEEEENLDSEDDYSEDDYFAVEVESEAERESRDSSDESDMAAYAGEPLADEEWLKWYEKDVVCCFEHTAEYSLGVQSALLRSTKSIHFFLLLTSSGFVLP